MKLTKTQITEQREDARWLDATARFTCTSNLWPLVPDGTPPLIREIRPLTQEEETALYFLEGAFQCSALYVVDRINNAWRVLKWPYRLTPSSDTRENAPHYVLHITPPEPPTRSQILDEVGKIFRDVDEQTLRSLYPIIKMLAIPTHPLPQEFRDLLQEFATGAGYCVDMS